FPGQQGGPFMQAIAAKAVALREAMQPEFRRCQARIVQNAQTLAQVLQERGLRLVTGGTDNHLVLVDVGVRRLTGREAANALEEAGIIVNKNPIPFDTRPTNITSGIRIGTPAITTRGMGPAEVEQIGEWIAEVLENLDRPSLRLRIREEVRDLCRQFPIYADYLEQ
ncbi:MAG TPA: serine hydroxymethyltransferase, partial [Armatimonadetes bacterium]|nr:serine hydroxymethyltransferase [Armatimonadota bacterium]